MGFIKSPKSPLIRIWIWKRIKNSNSQIIILLINWIWMIINAYQIARATKRVSTVQKSLNYLIMNITNVTKYLKPLMESPRFLVMVHHRVLEYVYTFLFYMFRTNDMMFYTRKLKAGQRKNRRCWYSWRQRMTQKPTAYFIDK